MARKIGNPTDAECGRLGRDHRQRISIREPERYTHRESVSSQPLIEFFQTGYRLHAQQLEGDGSGVFRIDMNGAGLERGMQYSRITQSLLMNGLDIACLACDLSDDLAQYVGFGKALGTDAKR